MTEGAYQRIRVSDRRQIWVEDAVGHAYDFRELSRGTRDQVYLALALALASAYRRSGIHVPMLLGDLFQNIDSDRAWSTAEVLSHFCTQDHQMVVLTRHEHVERLLSRYGARAFRLRPRDPRDDVGGHSHAAGHVERPGPKSPSLPDIPSPRARTDADLPWQTHWQAARVDASRVDKVPLEMVRPMASPGSPDAKVQKTERSGAAPAIPDDHLAADTASDPPPKIPGQRPGNGQASSDPSESIGWIREETDLHDVPLLEKDMTHHLRSHGVRTVGDFLSLTPEAGADYLATWNISATRVYRLQAQLSLQCYVGLSALDAALLVECGIDDPEDLSYIDTDELYHRIEERLANSEARSRYGSILRYERPRLARWIERARGCHYRRTLQAGRTRQPIPRPSSPLQKPRPASTPRATTPHEPATVAPMPPTAPSGQEGEARNETLRFYLEPADPVVDAPSIGPKTAERLHAVGIRTIADLLSSDPVKTAEEIDYRRITAELVATWQRQAQLVCRVPNLRGHDAQMLVACGVDSAESLARSTADSLLEAVTRFIRTSEGKRVLRNGRAPDATEVHSWIRWASHARTLEKAQP